MKYRSKCVKNDHIYEALTLYLRSMSIIDDNEVVVEMSAAMAGHTNLAIGRIAKID